MKENNTPFIITLIQEVSAVTSYVNRHFKDEQKTQSWLNSAHPLLNGKEPLSLIFEAKTEQLKKFIEETLLSGI